MPRNEEVLPPTRDQLRMVFAASAIPFVAFGFLDNCIMILAGETLDTTLCVAFSFTTMAAAAIGNTISDVVGIFSGGVVEELARRAGIEEPPLSNEQRVMRATKLSQYGGQVIGIVIGCFLGSCPLLWIKPQGEKLKHEKQQSAVFDRTMHELVSIFDAEAAMLFVEDEESETGDLWCKSSSVAVQSHVIPAGKGIVGHVMTSEQYANIVEITEEPLYDPEMHSNLLGSGIEVHSLLCMPIMSHGKTNGCLVLINKKGSGVFTEKDDDSLSMIATHIAIELSGVENSFDTAIATCKKAMAKQMSPEWSISMKQRKMNMYKPALQSMADLLHVEAVTLMLILESERELYTVAIAGNLPAHRQRVGVGVAGMAADQGVALLFDRRDPSCEDSSHKAIYLDSSIEVRTELSVPLIGQNHKCTGVVKCINKRNDEPFDISDAEYVQRAAEYLSLALQGPEAPLSSVVEIMNQRMHQKMAAQTLQQCSSYIICGVDHAANLPDNADSFGVGIDPYVTIQIVEGNPLENSDSKLERKITRLRSQDKGNSTKLFATSSTVQQCLSPVWKDTLAVAVPSHLCKVPMDQLFVHVLLWDHDRITADDLIAHAAFPLAQMAVTASGSDPVKPFRLFDIPGQEGVYRLDKARIWLSFKRVGHHNGLQGENYNEKSFMETHRPKQAQLDNRFRWFWQR